MAEPTPPSVNITFEWSEKTNDDGSVTIVPISYTWVEGYDDPVSIIEGMPINVNHADYEIQYRDFS